MPEQNLVAHALPVSDVLRRLETGPDGLRRDEAGRRLDQFGANRLEAAAPFSVVQLLLSQFKSVVVLLLLLAGVIALSLGERLDAAVIAVVLLLNAGIGFATEYRARQAIAALLELDVPRAVVVREGALTSIDAQFLVPGDIVVLTRGQRVPADGRVISESDLAIDEAALTGESLPVGKLTGVLPSETALAERRNMVHKGTMVATGTARVAVTATGMRTEVGRIGTLTAAVGAGRTPLERHLDDLGKRLVWLAVGAGGLVAALNAWQGYELAQVLQTGIALAVAAVPEALPAVATIALAVGVRRMAARHALVRHLPAVETLGSTTTICTDKTRTLTSGVMTVARIWTDDTEFTAGPEGRFDASDRHLRIALEVAVLASQPQSAHGGSETHGSDPVDAALLHAADVSGIDRSVLERQRPPVGLLPFSSDRKFMASFHRNGQAIAAYAKGAPDAVLARVGHTEDGRRATPEDRSRLHEINERLAAGGLRVLALAYGDVRATDEASVTDLIFAGFVGLIDPPAPGVKETVARLRHAGLRLIMLTGDQRPTAEAVSRDIGLHDGDGRVIGFQELERMSADDLRREVTHVSGFTRVTPEQKLNIVRALQANGEIVAMLGDGINDAAALKQADVGVAMGKRGTDVAKEAAAIVLQDDRLETIGAAVEEGRIIFDNVRKFVFYLFSCNLGEVLVLLAAGILGLPPPLAPLQILWLNLVTDTLPALALAAEPGEPTVMQRPPRNPRELLLSRRFLERVAGYGTLIMLSTLAAFVWFLNTSDAHAVSAAFTTLAMTQILHLGNARSSEEVLSLRRAFHNRYAVGAVFVTVALQLAALYLPPLARMLGLTPLPWEAWIVILPLSVTPALIGQGLRWITSRLAAASTRARTPSSP